MNDSYSIAHKYSGYEASPARTIYPLIAVQADVILNVLECLRNSQSPSFKRDNLGADNGHIDRNILGMVNGCEY
jgi:hypothetical protein